MVREVVANPELSARVDLRIPAGLVEGQGLPDSALTDENAGAVRNAGTDKEALLTANGNEHNLADTLGHVTAIGATEFRANDFAWVEAACHVGQLSPVPEDKIVLRSALRGLITASDLSLVQLGDFCSKVVEGISTRGLAVRDAIGWSCLRGAAARHFVLLEREDLRQRRRALAEVLRQAVREQGPAAGAPAAERAAAGRQRYAATA